MKTVFSVRWPLMTATLAFAFAGGCGGDRAPSGIETDAISAQTQAIINGADCTEEENPTAVALLMSGSIDIVGFVQEVKTVVCTGTLIAPDVVLTAAHCVDPAAVTGGFGELTEMRMFVTRVSDLSPISDPNFAGELSDYGTEASLWVKHPDFDINAFSGGVNGPGQYDDVALMFLSAPIDDIAPMPMITADEATNLTEGAAVTIAGWGQQDPNMGMFDTPPSTKQCGLSTLNELAAFEMQVGGDESTTRKCHGDSGGPTYIELTAGDATTERVIGITSHAYDESDCLKGGVDTRVDAYLDFFDAQMRLACETGERVWCDVEGILPPDYVVGPMVQCDATLVALEEGTLFDDAGADADPDTDGFQIEVTVAASDPLCAGREAQVLVNDEAVFIEELDDNGEASVTITLEDGDNTLVAQIGSATAMGEVATRTVTFDPAEVEPESTPGGAVGGVFGCHATHVPTGTAPVGIAALALLSLAGMRRRRA